MKFYIASIIIAMSTSYTTAAPTESISLVEREPLDSTQNELHKRASWSVTPYPGQDTCLGAGTAIQGSGSRGCTNIASSSAYIIITDGCTVSRWGSSNCFDPIGDVGSGTSACFTGQTMQSISVKC
jgi:hypothetical protein